MEARVGIALFQPYFEGILAYFLNESSVIRRNQM